MWKRTGPHITSYTGLIQAGASWTHYFWGGTSGEWGGGVVVVIMWHTAATTARFIYFFLFIRNIPKRINYIMKYLDFHLYRLCWPIVGDGQSNLKM